MILILLAHFPLVGWYVARLRDGDDERWGIGALVLALALTPRAIWRTPLTKREALLGLAVLLLSSAVALSGAPLLIRGGLVLLAIGAMLTGPASPSERTSPTAHVGSVDHASARGGGLARVGLLLLSLPFTATAQFYLGYPLRVLTAELSRPLIGLAGVATQRRGVSLLWSGGEVQVDAPCSGLSLLWTGAVLVLGLAAGYRLSSRATCLLGTAAAVALLFGNALRSGGLFLLGARFGTVPAWAHDGLGLAVFAVFGFGLAKLAASVSARGKMSPPSRSTAASSPSRATRRADVPTPASVGIAAAFALVLASAAASSLWSSTHAPTVRWKPPGETFPGWPDVFEGKPCRPLAHDEPRGQAWFSTAFPGKIGVFAQDRHRIVLRWVHSPSRAVHPAADCFRAGGYRVDPVGLVRDREGRTWNCFTATRDSEVWRVRERLHDDGDRLAWTDVSAWYWAACRASAQGPWWAVTVMEPMSEE